MLKFQDKDFYNRRNFFKRVIYPSCVHDFGQG